VALNELAAAYADQGRSDEGMEAGEQARDILVDLSKLQPANMQWQADLATSHHRIGRAHHVAGGYPQALRAYRAGLAIRERLAATDPGNSEWQSLVAECHSAIGDTLFKVGNKAGALESYRKGVAIGERLVADHPGDPRWQAKLSTSFLEVATVLPDHQHAEKLKTLRESVRVLEKATLARPNNTQWRRDLSMGYGHLIRELVWAKEYEAAFDAAKSGMTIAQDLLNDDPDNVDWQRVSSFVHRRARDAFVATAREDKVREIDDEVAARQAVLERRRAGADSDPGKKQ